jgi:hypothetical protein
MKYARWRFRWLLVAVAVVAVSLAGAVKWRRYAQLRDRIAVYSREEAMIRAEYQRHLKILRPCGNERQYTAALLGVAAERRRLIEECERAIRRLW